MTSRSFVIASGEARSAVIASASEGSGAGTSFDSEITLDFFCVRASGFAYLPLACPPLCASVLCFDPFLQFSYRAPAQCVLPRCNISFI
ncbi:unnamed protein product [Mycena citricolor]|uniref:Uncharacterized protein n=1 Tax=Mycena citricolor TaxID=2018698 RepID=A0AAD2GSM3_9AGAR|nr:unnamed protein product [Mycena citricolor]